ncbi:hypothetical protein [Xanthocytophaga agilis]|uniref:Class I SAM-dependent methyltransferase n=1 Tax=Xanthocytophaga agilis TaxID=3048010 RepID=A0AAE3QYP5_9BACT|nr:hypothetical protein [Xanthocytophaga agilis]MDJ1500466.1 hypothetical protein [Xanthocytophaga agilis]
MNNKGIWTLEEAKTGHIHSILLAQGLAKLFDKAQPVYDLGCGTGFYARYLQQAGFDVRAFEPTEGIEEIAFFSPIERLDLSEEIKPGTYPRAQILCLEVGEHIPAEYEDIVLNNLWYLSDTDAYIVLSWAVPGQGGLGHVNEKPNNYIQLKMHERNRDYCHKQSEDLRALAGKCWWFENTIMVFK